MRDFKKQRGRRAQYLRMGTGLGMMALLAAVAFGTAHAAWSMYGKFANAAAADAASQQEYTTLEAQYQDVSATVEDLGTSRGFGAAVRERYGVGLPGEREIDIVRESSSTAAAAAAPQGFWARLWQALVVW